MEQENDLGTVTLSAGRHQEILEWLGNTREQVLNLADELDQAFPADRIPMVKAHHLRQAVDDLKLTLDRALAVENHSPANEVGTYSYRKD